jgi:hypothetical protein
LPSPVRWSTREDFPVAVRLTSGVTSGQNPTTKSRTIRYPRLYKWTKRAAEVLIVFVGSYILGYVGIQTILSRNGLFLWNFWFGSVYSFIVSDFVYVMVVERKFTKYKKYPFIRFTFFLIGIYASADAVLAYSITFNEFINSPTTLPWVGQWVLVLSGGTFFVPWVYYRWKYKETKVEPPTTQPIPRDSTSQSKLA